MRYFAGNEQLARIGGTLKNTDDDQHQLEFFVRFPVARSLVTKLAQTRILPPLSLSFLFFPFRLPHKVIKLNLECGLTCPNRH